MAPEGLAGMEEDFMGPPARTQERIPAHSVGSVMEGLREATPSGDSPASTAEAAAEDSTAVGEDSTEVGEATEAEGAIDRSHEEIKQ